MRNRGLQWYWYECCRIAIRLGATLAFRTRYAGLENVPKTGPVLVVANHQSNLDPPLIGAGCRRHMNFLARQSLFRGPLGPLIRSLDAIPLDREGFGLAGVKETLRRLKDGKMVLIFPEGTRTPDGEIHEFKPGFVSLAVRAKAAILPAAIEGAFEAWPRGKALPRLRPVHVAFGKPIPFDELQRLSEPEMIAELERRVREAQAMLRDGRALKRKSS